MDPTRKRMTRCSGCRSRPCSCTPANASTNPLVLKFSGTTQAILSQGAPTIAWLADVGSVLGGPILSERVGYPVSRAFTIDRMGVTFIDEIIAGISVTVEVFKNGLLVAGTTIAGTGHVPAFTTVTQGFVAVAFADSDQLDVRVSTTNTEGTFSTPLGVSVTLSGP